MTDNDSGTEAERHRLRYALLESYYVMDAYFAGDREAGGEILTLIDDALCSENTTAMREALPLVTAAALPLTEDEEERRSRAMAPAPSSDRIRNRSRRGARAAMSERLVRRAAPRALQRGESG